MALCSYVYTYFKKSLQRLKRGRSDLQLFCVEVESATINAENVLEERDPQFDAMLGKMVGRISSKAGGKLEMGEVSCYSSFLRNQLTRNVKVLGVYSVRFTEAELFFVKSSFIKLFGEEKHPSS